MREKIAYSSRFLRKLKRTIYSTTNIPRKDYSKLCMIDILVKHTLQYNITSVDNSILVVRNIKKNEKKKTTMHTCTTYRASLMLMAVLSTTTIAATATGTIAATAATIRHRSLQTTTEAEDGSSSRLPCNPDWGEGVRVEIGNDAFPEEISWTLYDQATMVVVATGMGNTSDYKRQNQQTYCVPPGSCYEFTISDTYGDGLQADDGGYYRLYVDDTMIKEGAHFQFEDRHAFCTDELVRPEEATATTTTSLPLAAASPITENCADDPDFRYKSVKTCQWVGLKEVARRCELPWDTKLIKDYCQITCGVCVPPPPAVPTMVVPTVVAPTMTTAPDVVVDDEDGNCHDDPDYRYKEVKKCVWVSYDVPNRCALPARDLLDPTKLIRDFCQVTCGVCDTGVREDGGEEVVVVPAAADELMTEGRTIPTNDARNEEPDLHDWFVATANDIIDTLDAEYSVTPNDKEKPESEEAVGNDTNKSHNQKNNSGIIVGSIIGSIVLVGIIGCAVAYWKFGTIFCWHNNNQKTKNGNISDTDGESHNSHDDDNSVAVDYEHQQDGGNHEVCEIEVCACTDSGSLSEAESATVSSTNSTSSSNFSSSSERIQHDGTSRAIAMSGIVEV